MYTLPSDLWAILTVFRVDDSGEYVLLNRHDFRVRPSVTFGGPASTYRVVGSSIEFNPLPTSGDYLVVYVPVPPEFVLDTDTFDSVLGFEEYVVIACTIALLEKEQLDTDMHRADLAKIERDIIDAAKAAEMTEGHVVQDVRNRRTWLPGGNRGVTGYWGYPGSFYRGY
jgi:hypothetical protein